MIKSKQFSQSSKQNSLKVLKLFHANESHRSIRGSITASRLNPPDITRNTITRIHFPKPAAPAQTQQYHNIFLHAMGFPMDIRSYWQIPTMTNHYPKSYSLPWISRKTFHRPRSAPIAIPDKITFTKQYRNDPMRIPRSHNIHIHFPGPYHPYAFLFTSVKMSVGAAAESPPGLS